MAITLRCFGLDSNAATGHQTHMLIYKIFRADEWSALQAQGDTLGAPIDLSDGFIHFSTAAQAAETAAKHFANVDGLWLLALDSDALGEALKWEVSRGGAEFPHLYRKMLLSEVLWAKPLPLVKGVHQFPEEMTRGEGISAYVDPTPAQFAAFKALERGHPIEMLNLVRFKAEASYPEGHPLANAGLSGAEAYKNYGAESGPIFAGLGGKIVWRGGFETTLIGPADEAWDAVFVARYPDAHAFLAMVTNPDYQKAVVHRQAAVATSRLIRTKPGDSGATFG